MKIKKGITNVLGHRLNNTQDKILTIPNSPTVHYIVLDVYQEDYTYLQDSDIGHKDGNGSWILPSTERKLLKWDFLISENIQDAPSGHIYILYARLTDDGTGLFTADMYLELFSNCRC